MSATPALLLREWAVLQECVVPPLLRVGQAGGTPSMWALGSVADALAVAAAYEDARPDEASLLRVFASAPDLPARPVAFSLSDIRCVPIRSRRSAFERCSDGWVAGPAIADQVICSAPRQPVDLVTLRAGETTSRLMNRVLDSLVDGGYLWFVEGPPADTGDRLRPVDARRGLYRKCQRRSRETVPGADERVATLSDYQAESDLVASHARLARSLARRFSHHGEAKDDLEQVALLALVKAARRFDPARETSFSTYATASVLGEIKRHFRDKTWAMRVPRSVQERYLAIKEARELLTHELSGSPTIQQIAKRLGTTDEAVLEAMEAGENYWPESLDVGTFEGDTGRDVPVQEGGYEHTLQRQQLTTMLPRLAPRERLILKRLYFDGWTQRQVADEVGVSQMQISRLLARTMERLRTWADE